MVAHPGRGQVRDHVVAGAQLVHLHPALGRADEVGVRQAHPFGLAGGARGVKNHRHILSLHTLLHAVPHTRVVFIPGGTELFQLCGADQTGFFVFAQTAWVVVNDVGDAGHGLAHFQQFVHLFLVFGKSEVDVGILHHKRHFLGHRILVQRNGHGPQALHGRKAHVNVGAVVADEGQVLPPGQPQRRQATSQVAHVAGDIGPGPSLPNTELFFTQGRGCWALRCVA